MSVPLRQLDVPVPDAPAREQAEGPSAHGQAALVTWLDNTCAMVPGVVQAFAVLGHAQGPGFGARAAWPRDSVLDEEMTAFARSALERGSEPQIDTAADRGTVYLARRLAIGDGAAALVLKLPQPAAQQRAMLFKLLDWSAAWLAFALAHGSSDSAPRGEALAALTRAGMEAPDADCAATAMAIALAGAVAADSVSIGRVTADGVRLVARSHSASFDPRTRANRAVAAAMEEAIYEGAPIMLPPPADSAALAIQAHEALQALDGAACVLSVPLCIDDEESAVTLIRQRGAPFDPAERAYLVQCAEAIGRLLQLRRAAAQSWASRLRGSLQAQGAALAGPGAPGRKLVAGAGVVLIAVALLLDGTYQVAAPAALEGRIERTVIAPIDGYVAEAPARAGDAVRAGDLLAVLDTRALEFERRKWASEQAEAEKTLRQAVAKLDRAEAAINKARLGKASSELALVEARIARARVTAPFDGIVIAGDLSRDMGAPVNRGDVLFEIAPLDDYRVELEIDEHDVAQIAPGQRGRLALTALPGDALPFVVERVVGVAEARDGRNVFTVEAALEGDAGLLRPGMRGVGKVDVGERRLLWVWTHALFDRVRLWLWAHAP